MKYTANIGQAQTVGGVKIVPEGGELSEANAKAIMDDAWGKELVLKGLLVIETVKQPDNKDGDRK